MEKIKNEFTAEEVCKKLVDYITKHETDLYTIIDDTIPSYDVEERKEFQSFMNDVVGDVKFEVEMDCEENSDSYKLCNQTTIVYLKKYDIYFKELIVGEKDYKFLAIAGDIISTEYSIVNKREKTSSEFV
jgi:hypothetical protein